MTESDGTRCTKGLLIGTAACLVAIPLFAILCSLFGALSGMTSDVVIFSGFLVLLSAACFLAALQEAQDAPGRRFPPVGQRSNKAFYRPITVSVDPGSERIYAHGAGNLANRGLRSRRPVHANDRSSRRVEVACVCA